MIFRPYMEADKETLAEMLLQEGIEKNRMRFAAPNHLTFILEDPEVVGFFTLAPVRGVWYLQHLCISREKRTMARARAMISGVKAEMKRLRCPILLIGISKEKRYLQKIVEWYFKVKPYEENAEALYYSVKLEG